MNNILIGDDVINLDNMGFTNRSFVTRQYKGMEWVDVDPPKLIVTLVFPYNSDNEIHKIFRGAEAEAVWAYLSAHPDTFNLNEET